MKRHLVKKKILPFCVLRNIFMRLITIQFMPLSKGMKDKLINRNEIELNNRKANEYNIRQYILNFFKDFDEILWILDILPESQTNRLLDKLVARKGDLSNLIKRLDDFEDKQSKLKKIQELKSEMDSIKASL